MTTHLHDLIAQTLGFFSFLAFLGAYQIQDPRKSQLAFAPGNALYGLQYLMLGSTSAGIILLAASLRDIAGAYASDKILKIVAVLFLIFAWTIALLTTKSWPEYLIAFSCTFSTLAAVCRDHFYRYRGFLIGRQFTTLGFNIWIHSYAGIIHLACMVISNGIGIFRHHKKQKALLTEIAAIEP